MNRVRRTRSEPGPRQGPGLTPRPTSGRSTATTLAATLGIALTLCTPAHAQAPRDSSLDAARTKGSPNAPVTVYEMSDFQCPWCGRFARETLPALDREYIATGRVRFVFINLPLANHRNAGPAAELAMCAARQNRFWPVHDLLFRHQDRWSEMADPAAFFLSLGDSAGVRRGELAACIQNGTTRALVAADAAAAQRTGARSTPAFYIEGGLMSGAQPLAVFRQVLDSIIRVKQAVRR